MKRLAYAKVTPWVQKGIGGVILVGITAGLLGHATLLRTVPPANSRLEQAPQGWSCTLMKGSRRFLMA